MLLPAGHVGESNPRLTVPNGACYRYTNAAVLKGRGDRPALRERARTGTESMASSESPRNNLGYCNIWRHEYTLSQSA